MSGQISYTLGFIETHAHRESNILTHIDALALQELWSYILGLSFLRVPGLLGLGGFSSGKTRRHSREGQHMTSSTGFLSASSVLELRTHVVAAVPASRCRRWTRREQLHGERRAPTGPWPPLLLAPAAHGRLTSSGSMRQSQVRLLENMGGRRCR